MGNTKHQILLSVPIHLTRCEDCGYLKGTNSLARWGSLPILTKSRVIIARTGRGFTVKWPSEYLKQLGKLAVQAVFTTTTSYAYPGLTCRLDKHRTALTVKKRVELVFYDLLPI